MFVFIVVCLVVVCVFGFLWISTGKRPDFMTLKDAHVVITGGSSGIGKAVAIEVLKQGANVSILARNQERLQEAKEELENFIVDRNKQRIFCVSVDVAREYSAVKEAIDKAVNELGPCDFLVNSAGMSRAVSFEDTDIGDFQRVMNANYIGSVFPTRAVVAQMKKRRRGRIVFVSSQAGQIGVYGYTAYGSSKYALRGLAETLQMELKPYNIHITINFPPDTETPMLAQDQINMPKETALISETSGLHQPEQIAKIIVKDAQRGRFQSFVGFDGFFLATVAAGVAPVASVTDAVLQVLLMSLCRLASFIFILDFDRIIMKCYKERESRKRAQESQKQE